MDDYHFEPVWLVSDTVDRLRSLGASPMPGGIFGWDFLSPHCGLAALIDLRYDVAKDDGHVVSPRLTEKPGDTDGPDP